MACLEFKKQESVFHMDKFSRHQELLKQEYHFYLLTEELTDAIHSEKRVLTAALMAAALMKHLQCGREFSEQ